MNSAFGKPKAVTTEEIMWNLTQAMAPFLDAQQMFHLLEFQANHVSPPIFKVEALKQKQLEIVKTTNMQDLCWSIERQLRNLPEDTAMPQDNQEKKEQVWRKLETLEAKYEEVTEKLVNNEEAQEQIDSGRDSRMLWDILKQRFEFKDEDLETLFEYGKAQYDDGQYDNCDKALGIYCMLAPQDHSKHFDAIWGQLSVAIMLQTAAEEEANWDTALEHLNTIKETIDKSSFADPLKLLNWRAWLLHWSLFCYFNKSTKMPGKGGNKKTAAIIDLFLNQEEYRNAIETICPWLLRYLAVVIVTGRNVEKKHKTLMHLIRLIDQEKYNYSDPIIDFLICLQNKFDFEQAQVKLQESVQVLQSDYFLHEYADDYTEHGRILMFEMFCKIHQKIKIDTIAEKLSMTQEDAELWIVELIKNARLNAKIDSENGTIIMGNEPQVPYQQIISRTHNLNVVTTYLVNQLNIKAKGKNASEQIGVLPSWAKGAGAGGNKENGGDGRKKQRY